VSVYASSAVLLQGFVASSDVIEALRTGMYVYVYDIRECMYVCICMYVCM
jgi:hypothetical protein